MRGNLKCTGDQIQKMLDAGFSKQAILRLCDTTIDSPAKGTLSREEIGKKVQASATDINRIDGYWVDLPPVDRYYQALKNAGYISGWKGTPDLSGRIELRLTERGQDNILTGMSRYGSVACCDFKPGIEVTGIIVDPGGVMARGEFTVKPADPLKVLLMAKGEKDPRITGEARLRRYDDGWRVEHIRISSVRW